MTRPRPPHHLARFSSVICLLVLYQATTVTPAYGQSNAADFGRSATPTGVGASLETEEFRQVQTEQAQQNKSLMGRIGDEAVARAQSLLPRFNQLSSGVVHGKHVTVSDKGEEIVWRILSLPKASASERRESLTKLQGYATQQVPEALNFLGFASEHGLFGARRDMGLANRYYAAGAKQNYQPAVYNLALSYIYGKGTPRDQQQGFNLLKKAWAIGPELSYRICGISSFIEYKQNNSANAYKLANGCSSNLASLSMAAYSPKHSIPQRITMARDSLSAGVDFGFDVIAKLSQPNAAKDTTNTFCKYQLVRAYLYKRYYNGLGEAAERCYRQVKNKASSSPLTLEDQEAIKGLSGFPMVEIPELRRMRQSNRMHYAWGVPFLPFTQIDVNSFEPLITRTTP